MIIRLFKNLNLIISNTQFALFLIALGILISIFNILVSINLSNKIYVTNLIFSPSEFVYRRVIIWISIFLAIALVKLIYNYSGKYLLLFSNFIILVLICLLAPTLAIYIILVFTGKLKEYLFVFDIIFILVPIFFILLNKQKLLLNLYKNSSSRVGICFFSIVILMISFSQIYSFHYLNLESVIDYHIKQNKVESKSEPYIKQFEIGSNPGAFDNFDNIYIQFSIKDNDIYNQIEKASIRNKLDPIIRPTIIDSNKKIIRVRFDGRNRENICLFSHDVDKCQNEIKTTSEEKIITKYVAVAYVDDIIRTIKLSNNRVEVLNEIIENDNLKSPLYKLLDYSSKRGIYFHHYHAFFLGNINGGLSNLFTNQYGFGAGVIGYILNNYFDNSYFDSVYISILLVNILFSLAVIWVSIINRSRHGLILLIIGSIYLLFLLITNSFISPGLYPIRYFPIIIFSLIIATGINIKKNILLKIFLLFLYCISPFYNFEYGAMLTVAVAFALLVDKKIGLSTISFIPAVIAKLLHYILQNHEYVQNLSLYYISGIGFGTSLDYYSLIIFAIFIVLSLALNYKKYNFFQQQIESRILFGIFILTTTKFIWGGTLGQAAPPVLFFGLYIYSLLNSSKLCISKDLTYYYLRLMASYIALIIFLLTIFHFKNLIPHSKKFNIEYQKTDFSSYVLLDSRIVSRLDQIKSLVNHDAKKVNVISPLDSLYSLYLKRPILSPYPDLSSFLILSSDVITASNFLKKHTECIIIEKILINDPNTYLPLSNQFTEPYSSYNAWNYIYMSNLIKLSKVFVGDDYEKKNETINFIEFCKNA